MTNWTVIVYWNFVLNSFLFVELKKFSINIKWQIIKKSDTIADKMYSTKMYVFWYNYIDNVDNVDNAMWSTFDIVDCVIVMPWGCWPPWGRPGCLQSTPGLGRFPSLARGPNWTREGWEMWGSWTCPRLSSWSSPSGRSPGRGRTRWSWGKPSR